MKIALFISNRTTFPQELIVSAIEETSAALKRNGVEPVLPPAGVANNTQAEQYARFLKENPCDGVIAVFPNFGDESSCLLSLRDAGVPILFQAYPDTLDAMGPATRRDSFCGKISAVNLFRQCNVPCTVFAPHTVHPDSAAFDRNLRDFTAVCRIVNGMKRIRTGSIGARCTPFKTVRFDETALEKYGISNESFDLSEVFHRIRSITDTDAAVKERSEELRQYAQWPASSESALIRITKLSLAIDQMIKEYRLDLITLRCWTELEEELKISPCVVLSLLNNKKIIANCEVDTVSAIAMRALSLAADAPSACLDWNNNYGDDENACVLFHCGPVAAELMDAQGKIVDHPMFARVFGCGNGLGCNEGRMKAGEFTCASGYTREGKLVFYLDRGTFGDEKLPADFFGCGGVAHFENFQHKMLKLLRYGFSHHMSLCYGNYMTAVEEAFRSYLKYDVIIAGE
jgi:L-fucose isomerase-like protein